MRISIQAGLVGLLLMLSSRLSGGPHLDIETITARDGAVEKDEWQKQIEHALNLESKGSFTEAERTLLVSIHKAEQPNSDPLWLPTALDRLGGFDRHLGRSRQAEHVYLRAADLWQARFGSTSLGLAMTLSDLAWVYVELGDPVRAGSLWRHSLEIRIGVLGPYHPAVARVYGYMAVGAFAAHLLTDAESFCQQALQIYERVGRVPGETDQVLSSLASVRLRQGRALEAITLTSDAVDLGQTAKHPSLRLLAGYFYNLALAESAAMRPGDADTHFQHALSLVALAPSASPTLRLNILNSYAGFLSGAGHKKEARTIQREASHAAKVLRRESHEEEVADISSFR